MTIADLLGLIGAVGALAGVAWYFFRAPLLGPGRAARRGPGGHRGGQGRLLA